MIKQEAHGPHRLPEITVQTRNTVSNAHKKIPPAPPCFVWQSPCFALGNLIRIKT